MHAKIYLTQEEDRQNQAEEGRASLEGHQGNLEAGNLEAEVLAYPEAQMA